MKTFTQPLEFFFLFHLINNSCFIYSSHSISEKIFLALSLSTRKLLVACKAVSLNILLKSLYKILMTTKPKRVSIKGSRAHYPSIQYFWYDIITK